MWVRQFSITEYQLIANQQFDWEWTTRVFEVSQSLASDKVPMGNPAVLLAIIELFCNLAQNVRE